MGQVRPGPWGGHQEEGRLIQPRLGEPCEGRSETPQELAGRGWHLRGDGKREPSGRKTQACTQVP